MFEVDIEEQCNKSTFDEINIKVSANANNEELYALVKQDVPAVEDQFTEEMTDIDHVPANASSNISQENLALIPHQQTPTTILPTNNHVGASGQTNHAVSERIQGQSPAVNMLITNGPVNIHQHLPEPSINSHQLEGVGVNASPSGKKRSRSDAEGETDGEDAIEAMPLNKIAKKYRKIQMKKQANEPKVQNIELDQEALDLWYEYNERREKGKGAD